MKKGIIYILVFLFGTAAGFSQDKAPITGVFAASNGIEIIPAEDAEENLDDMVEYLTGTFSLKPKSFFVYKFSEPGKNKAFQSFYKSMIDDYDTTSVVISVLLGAWSQEGGSDASYSFILPNGERIGIDWLLNAIRFAPSSRMIVFSISPAKFGLPYNYLELQSRKEFAPGKILIDIQGDPEDDYDDWVSDFNDVLDDVADDMDKADANGDKSVSFSEWYSYLQKAAKEEKFVLTPFLFYKASDFTIYSIGN